MKFARYREHESQLKSQVECTAVRAYTNPGNLRSGSLPGMSFFFSSSFFLFTAQISSVPRIETSRI